ncbi:MAG TPA: hypothetical protein PLD62_06365 [Candidatus Cloacimonadota bacterium]|nr:hypothetical protein [Candidatus Cloacimonadota bacterium]
MKKVIILVSVLIILLPLFADEPVSMKNVSTGGVFSGTWENIYDPIDLGNYDKMYFFTNMADFSWKFNDLYSDYENTSKITFFEEFPFGIAFTNPFYQSLKHSFYVKVSQNTVPGTTNHYQTGEYEMYETEYEDLNNNGIYDTKTITYRKEKSHQQDDQKFDFIWNNSFKLGDAQVGLKLSSFSTKEEWDEASEHIGNYEFGNYLDGFHRYDHNEDYYYETYYIGEDDYFLRCAEKGVFLTSLKENQKNMQVSYQKAMDELYADSFLRLDLGIASHNYNYKIDDDYTGEYNEIITADTLVNSGNIAECIFRQSKTKQNDFYVSAKLKKQMDASFEGENGFWEAVVNAGLISGDRNYAREDHLISEEKEDSLNSVEYTIIESDDYNQEYSEDGDISGFHLGSHVLFNLPLNDNAAFGFGGYYNYNYTCGDYDYTSSLLEIESYRIGSAIDTASEYTQTTTEYISADEQQIIKRSVFQVPIALEFKIPIEHYSTNDAFGLRNFIFRLGTTYQLDKTQYESTYDIKDNDPYMIITEYGNGTVAEEHDNYNSLISEKTKYTLVTSTKRFSAGIGYQHSQNLGIDLGGSYNYDTKDYFVGLSFTISR